VNEPNAPAIRYEPAILSKPIGIPIAILLTLGFIILLFPWDSLSRRVAWEISAAVGSHVSIELLAPAVTARGPVLRARDVLIEHPAVDRVHLRELEIAPRWSSSWIQGEPKLRIWADSELGLIDGVLELGAAPSFVGSISRVELASLPLRLDASGVGVVGQIHADAEIALDPNGTLHGRVVFESPSLLLEADQLPMPIPLTQAKGVIVILEDGATQIESASFEGELIEGQLSGNIGLVHSSQSPPIDLNAKIRIVDPLLRQLAAGSGLSISPNGELSMHVSGTLAAPEIEPPPGGNTRRAQPRNRPGRPAR
jgi:type II secretion system protein N